MAVDTGAQFDWNGANTDQTNEGPAESDMDLETSAAPDQKVSMHSIAELPLTFTRRQ